ncbi:MAG: proline--tRNA ligase [Deltaproteobacteria bacterium]|nr:proline--tRNA ligase [Deltaproteobacteria bacterium]
MRMTVLHAPTLRDAPREAEVVSHQLLVRAGYIRQLAAGIYNLLPLGLRTVSRIARIVREEMDGAGAQEVLMPAVQPAELWQESGRWQKYGPELLRLKDRKGNDFCLGPTHEEVIVDIVRSDIRSYRQLPVNLYQIQAKFRDELRPRAGLMRGREFMMKDAYSFDVDEAGATRSYEAMYAAYERIFTRCGLDFRAVEADTGNIGGSLSHEFQVLAETGEDAIVSCDSCQYTANVELAAIGGLPGPWQATGATPAPEPVSTPGKRTIDEVCAFLSVRPDALVKTLVLEVDGSPWLALVRGDRELNLIKARKALGATELALAGDELVRSVTGAPTGFAGPVGLEVPVLADPEVMAMPAAVTGGNAADLHLRGVVPGVHFAATRSVDIRMAEDGDRCPRCAGHLRAFRGIEVGHVFYLGTRYSEPMGCTFLDQEGKERPMEMGCYGIGVTRIMAAAIEQNHDERGIVWPLPLAPFQVIVIPLAKPEEPIWEAAESLYDQLRAQGVDVVFDDRRDRPGAKFADADLIGFPLQIVMGKRTFDAGQAELKDRASGETTLVALDDLAAEVAARISAAPQ